MSPATLDYNRIKMYCSGGFPYMSNLKREKLLQEWGIRHRLYSYYYIRIQRFGKVFEDNMKTGRFKMMVDSGAHTWALKDRHEAKSGNLLKSKTFQKYADEYFEFLHKWKDHLDLYVVLDLIGNAKETWNMQKRMERGGLNPLPVYHWKEDRRWLTKYMDNYPYFGISGLGKLLWRGFYIRWADEVFSYICDPHGIPRSRIHGFSVSAYEAMHRYPWYSIDHTTYFKTGGSGKLHFYSGKRDYRIFVSNRHAPKMIEHNHITRWRKDEQEEVNKQLVHKYGVTLEDVMRDGYIRDMVNCKYFVELEDRLIPKPFIQRTVPIVEVA